MDVKKARPPSRIFKLRIIHLGMMTVSFGALNSCTPAYCRYTGGALPRRDGTDPADRRFSFSTRNTMGNGSFNREISLNVFCVGTASQQCALVRLSRPARRTHLRQDHFVSRLQLSHTCDRASMA